MFANGYRLSNKSTLGERNDGFGAIYAWTRRTAFGRPISDDRRSGIHPRALRLLCAEGLVRSAAHPESACSRGHEGIAAGELLADLGPGIPKLKQHNQPCGARIDRSPACLADCWLSSARSALNKLIVLLTSTSSDSAPTREPHGEQPRRLADQYRINRPDIIHYRGDSSMTKLRL
jgi:hypothetical protein